MTTRVVTAGPTASVGELAHLMAARRISAIPIVEGTHILGIVSEGDLVRRSELGTEMGGGSWWLRLFGDADAARRYVKTHARQAADVMTREPTTVTEDASLAEIAALFEKRHIKRVPVVRRGELVGIVSRANLVQALAVAIDTAAPPAPEANDDASLRDALLAELDRAPWWRGASSNVVVSDGVVHYWGYYDTDLEIDAARVAAENVSGVRGVHDHRTRYPVEYGPI